MAERDVDLAARLHFKAQTVSHGDPTRIRVGWWIGPPLCKDDELVKIGEWEMDREQWDAARRRLLYGEDAVDGQAHLDGSEGGSWNWDEP